MTLRLAESIAVVLRGAAGVVLLLIGACGGLAILLSLAAIPGAYANYAQEPEDLVLLLAYQPVLMPFCSLWGGGGLYVLTEDRLVSSRRAYAGLGLAVCCALAIPLGALFSLVL